MDERQTNLITCQRRQRDLSPFEHVLPLRVPMDCATSAGDQTGELAAAAQQEPQLRAERVLDIKRQLGEGRYEIEEKLSVVVDRLLEDLLMSFDEQLR